MRTDGTFEYNFYLQSHMGYTLVDGSKNTLEKENSSMKFRKELIEALKSTSMQTNNKHAVALLTMLRGPDAEGRGFGGGTILTPLLKSYTTLRVRTFIIQTPNSHLPTRLAPLTPFERGWRDAVLVAGPAHFRNHYNSAAIAIKALYSYDIHTETSTESLRSSIAPKQPATVVSDDPYNFPG